MKNKGYNCTFGEADDSGISYSQSSSCEKGNTHRQESGAGSRLTEYEVQQLQRRVSSLRNLVRTFDDTQIEMKSVSRRQDILQEMERCQAKLDSLEV